MQQEDGRQPLDRAAGYEGEIAKDCGGVEHTHVLRYEHQQHER